MLPAFGFVPQRQRLNAKTELFSWIFIDASAADSAWPPAPMDPEVSISGIRAPLLRRPTPNFPPEQKGLLRNVILCGKTGVGKMPACVEASNGVLTFGDLDDPESEVRKLLKTN